MLKVSLITFEDIKFRSFSIDVQKVILSRVNVVFVKHSCQCFGLNFDRSLLIPGWLTLIQTRSFTCEVKVSYFIVFIRGKLIKTLKSPLVSDGFCHSPVDFRVRFDANHLVSDQFCVASILNKVPHTHMDDAFDAYIDTLKDSSIFCCRVVPDSISSLFIP